MRDEVLSLLKAEIKHNAEQRKDSSAYKFIASVSSNIKKAIDTVDNFLKNRNIDLGAAVRSSLEKGKEVKNKYVDPNVERVTTGLKEHGSRISSDYKKRRESYVDRSQGPPVSGFTGMVQKESQIRDRLDNPYSWYTKTNLGVAKSYAQDAVTIIRDKFKDMSIQDLYRIKDRSKEAEEEYFRRLDEERGPVTPEEEEEEKQRTLWGDAYNAIKEKRKQSKMSPEELKEYKKEKIRSKASKGSLFQAYKDGHGLVSKGTMGSIKGSAKGASSALLSLFPELGSVFTGAKALYSITKFLNDMTMLGLKGTWSIAKITAKSVHKAAKYIIPGYALMSKGLHGFFVKLPTKIYNWSKTALGWLGDRFGEFTSWASNKIGEFGSWAGGKVKDVGRWGLDKAKGLLNFGSKEEPSTEFDPIVEQQRETNEKLAILTDTTREGLESVQETTKEGLEDVELAIDEDADVGDGKDTSQRKKGIRGAFGNLRDRVFKRKQEVEEEKKRAKGDDGEKDPGWLSKLLKKIGLVTGGLMMGWQALKRWGLDGLKWLGGQLWKGFKWAAVWTGKALWKGFKWTVEKSWEGVKWLGGKIWDGFKWIGRTMKDIMVGAFRGAGRILGNIGRSIISLPGLIGTSIAGVLGKLVPSFLKGGSGKAGKEVAKQTGKQAAKQTGKVAAKQVGKQAAKVGITRLLGRGVLTLLGPVGWTAMAAWTAYDLYKGYKWLTDGGDPDTASGKLTVLRVHTYGYNNEEKDQTLRVLELETILQPYLRENRPEMKIELNEWDEEVSSKILTLFNIDDPESQEAFIFNDWFNKRFQPAFLAFHTALLRANYKLTPLNEVDKMTPKRLLEFLHFYKLPSGLYNYTHIPDVEDYDPNFNYQNFNEYRKLIREEILKDNQGLSAAAVSIINSREKMYSERTKLAEEKKRLNIPDAKPGQTVSWSTRNGELTSLSVKETPGQSKGEVEARLKQNLASSGDIELESVHETKEGGADNDPVTNVSKEFLAPGELQVGDASLEGIRLASGVSKETITKLDPAVFSLFTGMAKEYKAVTGKDLGVNFGWRSRSEQERLYNTKPKGQAAKPGSSLHEYGYAIDVNSGDIRKLNELGLLKKYGFATAIGKETWHLEPIGISLDDSRAKTDPEWARKMVLASPGRGGGGFALHYKGNSYKRNHAFQRNIFEDSETNYKLVEQSDLASLPYADGMSRGLPPDEQGRATSSGGLSIGAMFGKVLGKAFGQSPDDSVPSSHHDQNTSYSQLGGNFGGGGPNFDGISSYSGYDTKPGPVSGTVPSGMDLGSVSPNMDPITAIKQASDMTGVDFGLLETMAKLESGLRTDVKASTSSATGLFQFTTPTWKEMVKKVGPRYGIPLNADRSNPLHNSIMGAEYIKQNTEYIKGHMEANIPTPIALYLAHFLGPGGARNFIRHYRNNPNTPMSSVVSRSAYTANLASMGGKTAAQFLAGVADRFKRAAGTDSSKYGSGIPSSSSIVGNQYASSVPNMGSDNFTESLSVGSGPTPAQVSSPSAPNLNNLTNDISTQAYSSPTQGRSVEQSVNNIPSVDLSVIETTLKGQLHISGEMLKVLQAIGEVITPETLEKLSKPSKEATDRDPQTYRGQTKTLPKGAVNMTRHHMETDW